MQYVLGIDGGGTKTLCLCVDTTGKICGRGEGGPANYQTIGISAAQRSITQAIAQSIQSMPNREIRGICIGLAGVGRSEDVIIGLSLVKELMATANLPIHWQVSLPIVCSDSTIALVGGVGRPEGIVVIAGTGAMIFGQNSQGRTKRASGWGPTLGDEGGAYDIAIKGLRAIVRSADGRARSTILTQLMLEHLELTNIDKIVEVVYRRGWGIKEIASLAPLVEKAAQADDPVAYQIITDAVAELVLGTKVVMTDLFRPDQLVEIVTIGGVWRGIVFDLFAEAIQSINPVAQIIKPRHEPAYGAAILALQSSQI